MPQRHSRILGIGHRVPDRVVTNQDLEALFDTTHDWIVQRTGIEARRWVEGDVGAADLAEPAARAALEMAGLEPEDLDLIIFATLSPDLCFPGSGCLLQARLGLGERGTPALDVRTQCTGFLYGLSVADRFIRGGVYDRVLVVGAEVHSTGLDMRPEGRDVSVLFGDGAGAVVLGAADTPGILTTELHADGRFADALMTLAPASCKNPRLSAEMLDAGAQYPAMKGRLVFKHAVERMPEVVLSVLDDQGLSIDDVALLVPHQANLRINQMAARKLGLPDERVFHNIMRYGNTTAASIPIALSEARAEGRVQPGDLVALAAFGAGFTWGATLLRW